jgi:hypothetical protein
MGVGIMGQVHQPKMIFIAIEKSTLQKILLIDIIIGSGLYYIIKIISSSLLIATIASMAGTEGIKTINRSAFNPQKK